MKRFYENIIKEHFERYNKMLFLAGSRQVGKTTLAEMVAKSFPQSFYLNWDNEDHQRLILAGPKAIIEQVDVTQQDRKTLIIFDEIYKYTRWKSYIKGFFDTIKM